MFLLTSVTLVTLAAFTTANRQITIDPNSNFHFSFQHFSEYQDPTIDIREENLGKYIGRPKPRTTTIEPIIVPEFSPNRPIETEVPLQQYGENTFTDRRPIPTGAPIKHYARRPPPKAPELSDQSSQYYPQENEFQPRQPLNQYSPEVSSQTPMDWNDQPIPTNYWNADPTPGPIHWSDPNPQRHHIRPTSPPQNQYGTIPQFEPQQPQSPTYQPQYERSPQPQQSARSSNRGKHKYDWADVQYNPAPESGLISTTTAPTRRYPPPSIPHLTPWSGDNF